VKKGRIIVRKDKWQKEIELGGTAKPVLVILSPLSRRDQFSTCNPSAYIISSVSRIDSLLDLSGNRVFARKLGPRITVFVFKAHRRLQHDDAQC
jgi:hypothetical protein